MEIWIALASVITYLVFTPAVLRAAENGHRLTTFALENPLFIKAEILLWPLSVALIAFLLICTVITFVICCIIVTWEYARDFFKGVWKTSAA